MAEETHGVNPSEELIEKDDASLIHVELMDVTPEMAQRMLATNAGNRPVRLRTVMQLAETMRAGEWRLTGEALKIDRNGNLIDGQHRLLAVIEADTAVKFHAFYGLARDVYRHLDTGVVRSYADVLKIDQVRNANALANAATWVYRYLRSFTGAPKISHEMADHIIDEHPRLPEFIDYRAKGLIQPGLAVAFRYLCAMRDEDRAARFFKDLADGTARAETPVYTLRERLIRERTSGKKRTLTTLVIAAFIIKAWNADVSNEKLPTLTWRRGEKIPVLLDIV